MQQSTVRSNDSDSRICIIEYLKNTNHAILSDQDKEMFEMELSLDESGITWSSPNNNSAPFIYVQPVRWFKLSLFIIKLMAMRRKMEGQNAL